MGIPRIEFGTLRSLSVHLTTRPNPHICSTHLSAEFQTQKNTHIKFAKVYVCLFFIWKKKIYLFLLLRISPIVNIPFISLGWYCRSELWEQCRPCSNYFLTHDIRNKMAHDQEIHILINSRLHKKFNKTSNRCLLTNWT